MNKFIHGDSRCVLQDVDDETIHLIITSPPYNVGKEYELDSTLETWRALLQDVFKECYRVLIPGGRICVNIANTWRKPYLPLHRYVMEILENSGFSMMRGEIIWDKGASVGTSTAWGSWKRASNPVLRDVHEYILIYSKGKWGREPGKSTITRDEFLECTKSIWRISTASSKETGHPASFPLELPSRLIKLYSYEGDVVLDPFAGTGNTCIAAKQLERYFIGIELLEKYVEKARERIFSARS